MNVKPLTFSLLCFAFTAAGFVTSLNARQTDTVSTGDFTVHTHRDKGALATYSYIVETRKHSVLIDAGFSAAEGRELRAMLDDIGKPVAAVLLTHAHPGHYGGVTAAVDKDVPFIAAAGVARQFQEYSPKFSEFTGASADSLRGPDVIYGHGQSLEIDAVQFTVNVMGPGEAEVDTWWRVNGASEEAAFAGGLVAYEIHPILTGHSKTWMQSLQIMKQTIDAGTPIYPGYNPNAEEPENPAGGHELLDWQISYLHRYREIVESIANGRTILRDDEITEISTQMNVAFPDNQSLLFVSLGAETIAAELAMEAALARTDDRFRKLFGQ